MSPKAERRDWRVVYRPEGGQRGIDVMRQAATRLTAGLDRDTRVTRADSRVVVQGRAAADAHVVARELWNAAAAAELEPIVLLSYWSATDDAWTPADFDTVRLAADDASAAPGQLPSGPATAPSPAGAAPAQGVSGLVVGGYILAVVIPIVGIVLGIVAVTSGEERNRRHGPWIIGVGVGVILVGALLIAAAAS